jgi:hypothetical protein
MLDVTGGIIERDYRQTTAANRELASPTDDPLGF